MTLYRIIRRIAFASSLLACLSVPLAGPARADELQDINRLLRQGQHAQALDQVDKYLSGKPKDAQGRFLKRLILTEMNKAGEAVAVFQKLTEDYPELPEPYNNLAVIYAQQKQYDKAKQALEMAIRTHPSYATAHENLGDIYARMASQAYDKALQIDSSNTSAQTKLSMIRDLMGGNHTARAGQAAAVRPVAVAAPAAKPVDVKQADPAPVKPAEVAKPAVEPRAAEPKTSTAKIPAGNPSAEVAKSIEAWTAAWSKKDVKAYLAHYAPDFKTPGGESRAEWEAERSRRISKPGTIVISIEHLNVTLDGNDKATARFRQYYRSGPLKTAGNKMLVLARMDGRWLIQQEKVGN